MHGGFVVDDGRTRHLERRAEPPTPPTPKRWPASCARSSSTPPVTAKKALAQRLVHEIQVTSRDDIRPIFRVPTRPEPSPGERERVRKLVGALPTSQHTNLPPLVEGPAVQLARRHAKVRRAGYRR
jgi:hypothetical protein